MKTIERKTYSVDASGKVLGRLATDIARHLMVIVTNVAKMKLTGNKMDQKLYYRHSGHPGGLKTQLLRNRWEKDPADVLKAAVSRMLPKTKARTARLLRLKIS
jgi:large subunit ribosomal protein L13